MKESSEVHKFPVLDYLSYRLLAYEHTRALRNYYFFFLKILSHKKSVFDILDTTGNF